MYNHRTFIIRTCTLVPYLGLCECKNSNLGEEFELKISDRLGCLDNMYGI